MRTTLKTLPVLLLAAGLAGCFGPGKTKVRPGDQDLVVVREKNLEEVIATGAVLMEFWSPR